LEGAPIIGGSLESQKGGAKEKGGKNLKENEKASAANLKEGGKMKLITRQGRGKKGGNNHTLS